MIPEPVALIKDIRSLVLGHKDDCPEKAITGKPFLTPGFFKHFEKDSAESAQKTGIFSKNLAFKKTVKPNFAKKNSIHRNNLLNN